ncbi:MAG: hypothetical protein MRZ86_04045 [Acidaminococcus sp.]|nr:hypothetical protein [Acidaminococcus sp.]
MIKQPQSDSLLLFAATYLIDYKAMVYSQTATTQYQSGGSGDLSTDLH